MSIQILDIVLYSLRGERRLLSFRPGEMNIITGDSKTGKSALVSIVDYCLGSSSCGVPAGVIRNSVSWYALRITDGSAEHFIARRAPDRGRTSNSGAYYTVGSTLIIPNADELSATTNIDAVIERLKSIVGINLSVHEPPEGQTRNPLTTTLRHALAFVFQPQNEISQPDFLFHSQSDNWVAQAIKDTLPYFLGAVDDNFVAGKARLRELQRSLRDRERTLARLETLASGGLNEAAALLAEGRNAGLLAQDETPESWDAAVEILRVAVNASPEEQLIRYEESPDQTELLRLSDERASLRHQLARHQDELEAMQTLLSDENGFVRETHEQVSRLTSLRLFANSEEPCCPLCNQPTTDLPSSGTLEVEMQRASEQLERVTRHTPGLEALILEQEQRINETKRLLQENRTALDALRRADDRLTQLRDSATRRAYVLGRISLFLETLPQVADNSDLRAEISELQREIEQLETELSDENIQERLDSILSVISRNLTAWAERLELEHGGNPFRLDLRYLQVVADTNNGPIRMDNMGSGANWVGCHLIAHLALHSWFVQKLRPVPRFLFLDQPSQVYYPAEQNIESSLIELEDEDRVAVIRMFELVRDVVNGLHSGFQVIITEHADIAEDWYQGAVVERWRNGNALIPAEWIPNEP
ncbi:MAG: DUF3732 domain-containing protein [Myxacorys californica WJT36-NPBG1]|nr:DUF3732 domain-containing protein [Myxacorys californica WJT36-NPBG1]